MCEVQVMGDLHTANNEFAYPRKKMFCLPTPCSATGSSPLACFGTSPLDEPPQRENGLASILSVIVAYDEGLERLLDRRCP